MTLDNEMGPSREWLLKMADGEDACRSISVGGMAVDLGIYAEPEECDPEECDKVPLSPAAEVGYHAAVRE